MKKQLLILLILCAGVSVSAQQSTFSIQYSMGFGTGDLGGYNSEPSFRGATIEWHKYLKPTMSVGFEAGWNAFYNSFPTETYTYGNASLSGKHYRYQNQMPLLVSVDYHFNPDATLKPFAGLGIGTMYSRRDMDMNIYRFTEDAWHFAIRPEVGFMYQVSPEASGYLGLKYYTGLKSGDFSESQSYIALNIGFVLTN